MFLYTLYDFTKDTDKMPTSSIFTPKNNYYGQLATIDESSHLYWPHQAADTRRADFLSTLISLIRCHKPSDYWYSGRAAGR